MTKFIQLAAMFIAGLLIGALIVPPVVSAAKQQPLPAPSLTTIIVVTPTPAPTPTQGGNPGATTQTTVLGNFGLVDTIECWNCTPVRYKARLTNYDPLAGKINCWDWDAENKYCWSSTSSGLPWEVAWGWSAACPMEWPLGSWVEIPNVGVFVCLDRGDMVKCEAGICAVDILGPGGLFWNGAVTNVTLWIPAGHWQHKWENLE